MENIYRLRSTSEAEPVGTGCWEHASTCADAFRPQRVLDICISHPVYSRKARLSLFTCEVLTPRHRTKERCLQKVLYARRSSRTKLQLCHMWHDRHNSHTA